jgi:hypothetical protein
MGSCCEDVHNCGCPGCQLETSRLREVGTLQARLLDLDRQSYCLVTHRAQAKSIVALSQSLSPLTGEEPLSDSSIELMHVEARLDTLEKERKAVLRRLCSLCPECPECAV